MNEQKNQEAEVIVTGTDVKDPSSNPPGQGKRLTVDAVRVGNKVVIDARGIAVRGGNSRRLVTTHSNSATGAVTYAHGLSRTPTKVTVQSTNITGGASFSSGCWDGASNGCVYGGSNAGNNNSKCVWVDQGGGNYSYGEVTAVDEKNVTNDLGQVRVANLVVQPADNLRMS